ncbi:MAG: DUF1178 family protein [Deltaproteobacteria bacterium]|nr:DUF1178 family protein [Deltaproteobacteria bacterium]
MIVFDLNCLNGHSFEGWFKDLESFNEQNSKGMITCPFCKSTSINRVLSPVAIKSSQGEEKKPPEIKPDYQKLANGVMEYIKNNFDDVGTDFTKEALKMHYGVAEKRNIRGSATEGEEETLRDEGIKYIKVPPIKTQDDES